MRWLVRLLGVVVSLALLAGLALFLIPTERIAGLVAQRFAAETGRELVIEGVVRPSIYPLIGVRMEEVRLANADWSDAPTMVRAEVVDVGLDVAALWAGDIVIRRLELRAPDVLLERNAAGQENWAISWGAVSDPAPDEPTSDAPAPARTLALDLAEISDGRLRFRDAGAGIDMVAEAVAGTLRLPALDREASLRLSGRMNGQPFTVQAQAGQPGALLDGRVSAVALSGEAAGASFGFDGRAGGTPLALEGQVDLDLPALGPVLAFLGQSGADLPQGVAPLRFSGAVTRAASGTIHAREARLRAGANALSGAADLRLDGARPQLTAQLSAEALDLRPLTGGGNGAGQNGAPGWSRAPLNLAALGALDADVTLSAPSIETGAVRLGPTRLGLRINNARAVFDLREVRLFDGGLSGEFVLNGRGGGSVGGDLRASDVALLPLLRDLAGVERLQGQGSAQVRFLGVGNSMHAIMSSLSGEGRIDLGQGEILGLDLAGMLRTLDMSYMGEGARTVYDRVTGSFTMDGGVLRNDDLRLEASRLSVSGRGTVGIGERVLNYRVVPEAMRDPETGDALRVPLLITGPWDAPRFRLDLEALAEERLREEAARLEELAREEARRREEELRERAERELQDRLGVEREEGESLEDAARRRLQDEIGRGLGRLLGSD